MDANVRFMAKDMNIATMVIMCIIIIFMLSTQLGRSDQDGEREVLVLLD